jgi:hypothetical protein
VTYKEIEMDYPGWENSFTYANKRFERYIERKRDGKAGSVSETVKVAIAVFNFLKKKFIEQTIPSVPEELLASASIEEIEHYIIKTYGNEPETYGWVRATGIVEAVCPSHRRLGSDSSEQKYPHKNKTLVYRVLSEMTDLYLVERQEESWKKVYYRLVVDASGEVLDLTKEELLERYRETMISALLQADRYRAAIDLMKTYGIPDPEQQVKELVDNGGSLLYTTHKRLAVHYSKVLNPKPRRISPQNLEK